jgi:SAM-dependent methyltransferase
LPQVPEEAFKRTDETPDEEFDRTPRLVTHIDDGAIAAVTQLYRELFPTGGEILDLMSSWISHLPLEVAYRHVIGLGMNEVELRRNERLDSYIVHNLNSNPQLPFGEAEFDGVGICVSIDYLTRPVEVLREVGRVLKVDAPLIITFSNRCFPTKAVEIWRQLDDRGHMRLVESYLEEAGNFRNIRSLDRSPRRVFGDPLYAVVAESAGPYVGGLTGYTGRTGTKKERDEHSPGERDRQGACGQAAIQGDLLRQAHQRRGLGHHHQGGQLHRLRPGRGTWLRTHS